MNFKGCLQGQFVDCTHSKQTAVYFLAKSYSTIHQQLDKKCMDHASPMCGARRYLTFCTQNHNTCKMIMYSILVVIVQCVCTMCVTVTVYHTLHCICAFTRAPCVHSVCPSCAPYMSLACTLYVPRMHLAFSKCGHVNLPLDNTIHSYKSRLLGGLL